MPELISEFKHVSNNWEIQSRREEEPLWIEAWAENQGSDLYKFYLNTSKEIESCEWDFGDGIGLSTIIEPSYQYPSAPLPSTNVSVTITFYDGEEYVHSWGLGNPKPFGSISPFLSRGDDQIIFNVMTEEFGIKSLDSYTQDIKGIILPNAIIYRSLSLPIEGDSLTLNGVPFVFRNSVVYSNEVKISESIIPEDAEKETFANLFSVLDSFHHPLIDRNKISFSLNADGNSILVNGVDDVELFTWTLSNSGSFPPVLSGSTLKGTLIRTEISFSFSNVFSTWYEILPGNLNSVSFPFNPKSFTYAALRFSRFSIEDIRPLEVLGFTLGGLKTLSVVNPPKLSILGDGECVILKPEDKYKVYKFTGIKITTYGETSTSYFTYKFRYSWDSGRRWSSWTDLTEDNIKSISIDPLAFFMIEYQVCKVGTGSSWLMDIELLGQVDNVSCGYKVYGYLGLRSCCSGNAVKSDGLGATNPYTAPVNITENLFNPYQLGGALEIYKSLSSAAGNIFGWNVEYFRTDPDGGGSDPFIHEYQLYNVIEKKNLKVLVPENQFPEDIVTFNRFDLSLFDSFEVHITKEQFKLAFGDETRPGKNDYFFFCELNKMYDVEISQAYRDFMNSSTFYKVMLVKHQDKKSRRHITEDTKTRTEELTAFSSLDELFGKEMEMETKKVTEKEQYTKLTTNTLYSYFDSKIKHISSVIDNGGMMVTKGSYDLSLVPAANKAIVWNRGDVSHNTSESRTLSVWMRLNAFTKGTEYLIFNNNGESGGWKLYFKNKKIYLLLNSVEYILPVPDVEVNIWYSVMVSWNSSLHTLTMDLYTRSVPNTTEELVSVSSETWSNLPNISYTLPDTLIETKGSNLLLSNWRVMKTFVPKTHHSQYLNQYIIERADYLLLADNADKRFNLPNYGSL